MTGVAIARRTADVQGGLGMAMRIGIELVVATFIGAGAGVFADKKLGTTPWLTLLGFILGSAAGIRNVMRLADQMGQPPLKNGGGEGGDAAAGDTGSQAEGGPENGSDAEPPQGGEGRS